MTTKRPGFDQHGTDWTQAGARVAASVRAIRSSALVMVRDTIAQYRSAAFTSAADAEVCVTLNRIADGLETEAAKLGRAGQ